MLIDKFIEIKIYKNSKNKNYYKNKGYNVIDNTALILNIDDLPKSSTFKVNVICDICGSKNYIEYRQYIKNIQKYNYYSCRGICSDKKIKNTNIERYNVENTSKLEVVKNKIKTTNLKKYGVENVFQDAEIKEKIKKTNLLKYGYENPNQNKEVRNKNKKTCLEKYGVEHPMQNEIIFHKNEKICFSSNFHKETGLYYRSSYEKHFLDFCVEKKLKVKKGKRINYIFNNEQHYYFSDFFIEEKNLIIEIKSSWTYQKDLSKNIIKKYYTLKSGYNFLFLIDKNYNEIN